MPHDFDPDAAASSDSGIYGLPNTVDDAKVVLLPVPWDATTSYRRGTAKGPAAILAASRQVDLHDLEYGDFYTHVVVMLDENPDYLPAEQEKAEASGEFRSTAVVTLEFSGKELERLLNPTSVVLPAAIVPTE